MSTTDKAIWIELVGQLTATLITALKGGGMDEQATQVQAIAHSNEVWRQVLQAAQGDVIGPKD